MPRAAQRRSEKWLESEGVKNINSVNECLKAASSWYAAYGVASVEALAIA